jgi:hypothetical protein
MTFSTEDLAAKERGAASRNQVTRKSSQENKIPKLAGLDVHAGAAH